jgi:DNA-binding response OmpR family regulator
MASKILIVDDDPYVSHGLQRLLQGNGYAVTTCNSAESGWEAIVESQPDLMLLDVGLPEADGVSLCRRVRTKWSFPIIMLTARSASIDKVVGLEVGADDYVTKPFDAGELLARVRAHLRRTSEYGDLQVSEVKSVAGLTYDASSRRVEVEGRTVELTTREVELLEYFLANVGRVLDRETIFEKVWGYKIDFNSNSLDVIVSRLRKKLEVGNSAIRYVHTVRGYGYKFDPVANE